MLPWASQNGQPCSAASVLVASADSRMPCPPVNNSVHHESITRRLRHVAVKTAYDVDADAARLLAHGLRLRGIDWPGMDRGEQDVTI